jgi:hypothetical protein
MDHMTYEQMPKRLQIRELAFRVAVPGFRVDTIVLATTLLDATAFCRDDIGSAS